MKKGGSISKQDMILGLPVLPRTLWELVKLSEQKEPDFEKLKTLLFEDVCLCIKGLKEINSSEGRKTLINSLSQGLENLDLEYFLIKGLSSSVYIKNSDEVVWFNNFNQRSVLSALVCRIMGRELDYPDLDELYLCGLLHDIGILFLKSSFPEEYALVLEKKNNGEKLSLIEREILATDHLEAGERAVQEWDFPKNLRKAILGHEFCKTGTEKDYDWVGNPPEEDSMPTLLVPRIVGVAEQISEVFFVETDPKALEGLAEIWEKSLRFPTGFFKRIYPELMEEVNRRISYYQSIPEDLVDIVLQSHRALNGLYENCEEKSREKLREFARKTEEERKKAELESLKVILATFSHYINNATTSIMGRSQLIDIAIKRGEIKDESGKISSSMKIIQQGVENITAVLNGLKKLNSFRTIRYHEHSNIIDIGDKIDIKGL